jgi:hypothetical protein
METEQIQISITYKMLRGEHEVAETCITLPISAARYAELAKGVTPNNRAWCEIQGALERLTFLQGYDELGTWGFELNI